MLEGIEHIDVVKLKIKYKCHNFISILSKM